MSQSILTPSDHPLPFLCFANTPPPPYVAVIFTSHRVSSSNLNQPEVVNITSSPSSPSSTPSVTATTIPDYGVTANRMLSLAHTMEGFLGEESVRDPVSLVGITVSYWRDNASVVQWKNHTEHLSAQENGRKYWYSNYSIRVCQVERAYTWIKKDQSTDEPQK